MRDGILDFKMVTKAVNKVETLKYALALYAFEMGLPQFIPS
jgi:hypothetical protein